MRQLLVVFLVLCLVAAIATLAGILLAGERPALGAPSVLVWRVAQPVSDHLDAGFLPIPGRIAPPSVSSLHRSFRAARRDASVKGVAVYIQDARFGLAKAQELRRQLALLRAAGKFVDCYLETAGEGSNGTLEYYLATACESIRLAPAGELNLLGLYLDAPFLRGTLDKLKIEPVFNAVGRYKSAGETFTEAEHSAAAEEALQAVLDSEYAQIVDAVARRSQLPHARVRALFDNAPYDAAQALRLRLVDALAYPDEFRALVEQRGGGEPRLLDIADYRPPTAALGGRTVAVLFAGGAIVRGRGGVDGFTGELFLGSDDLHQQLEDLREDDAVAAVVLRIDSPGGSALASDLILRDVERLATQKPVVVSMSDVAASGGYYIAAKARTIVAEAATITGSIGVVSGKFVTSAFESELLGISHDPLQRGNNAGIYGPRAPFTPQQEARVQAAMQRVYDTFVGHVAAGRRLSREAVDAAAQGRVWTGADALRVKLVDELGGLDLAIERARAAAGVDAAALRIAYYPSPPSLLDLLRQAERPPRPLSLDTVTARLAGRGELLELPRAWRGLTAPF